jgi:uncharacterized protein DUF6166
VKVYKGERLPAVVPMGGGVVVTTAVRITVDGEPLNARFDLREHSPTGFEWGYEGSGPAQLALAILADHLAEDDRACELYQEFKRRIVARLPRGGWSLTSQQIEAALKAVQEGQRL